MEAQEYLPYLGADGEALAAAARKAPTAPIPSCPEWHMTELLGHMSGVHRWAGRLVSARSPVYVPRPADPPEGPDAVLEWYEEGLAALLTTLAETEPDAMVWNWRDRAPGPARFWFRRMAHETAIHRWDGESGAGAAQPLAAELAVDGIDEYLSFVGPWLARTPVAGLEGSLHLHATDIEGEWSLNLWPDRLDHNREHAKADAAIRGPVSDLLLWMVNRIPADWPSLTLFGDPAIVARWGQLKF